MIQSVAKTRGQHSVPASLIAISNCLALPVSLSEINSKNLDYSMSKLIFFVALACTQFSCATIKSELKLNRHAVMDHTAPRVFDPDFSVTVLDLGRV